MLLTIEQMKAPSNSIEHKSMRYLNRIGLDMRTDAIDLKNLEETPNEFSLLASADQSSVQTHKMRIALTEVNQLEEPGDNNKKNMREKSFADVMNQLERDASQQESNFAEASNDEMAVDYKKAVSAGHVLVQGIENRKTVTASAHVEIANDKGFNMLTQSMRKITYDSTD